MPEQQNNLNHEFSLRKWICKQLDIKPDNRKKKTKIPKRTHFTIWYVIIVFFVLSLIQQIFLSGSVQNITYGAFKKSLSEGKVKYVNITPQLIQGVFTDGQSFVSIRVDDPKLAEQLDAQGWIIQENTRIE